MHVNIVLILTLQFICHVQSRSVKKKVRITFASSLSDVEYFMDAGEQLHSNTIPIKQAFWPGAKVPYDIRENDFNEKELAEIRAAINEFRDKTCVKFVPREKSEKSYVLIKKAGNCKSDVGRLGGRQVVMLATKCMEKGVVIHELMHALGFLHEQERSDRDDYVHVLWKNVDPKMQQQFARLPKAVAMTTAYDYDSIMHYDRYAFTKNGYPTMETKKSANIGQRDGFSFMDLLEINILYQCDKEIKTLKFL